MLNAFTSRLGVGQGRIEPVYAPRLSQNFVFALGDDQPGRLFDLDVGDYAEVTQATDVTDVDLVRALLRLRVPASLPAGYVWQASIVVDGAKQARATCRSGRKRIFTDLAANVSKLSGVHEVGVRLELAAAI